jgi:ribonuclease E
VINQTEALVAIDVNSGKATRERNIEATALKTNMEAAEEACRQLRLRDLAGLIVIDFIDMEESKNNRAVEKILKDNLKDDRARVQMGRISSFGLMEISRQRRRTGVLEGTTHVCPHCEGVGRVRSVESSALSALRAVEMEALRGGGELTLKVPAAVGLYILNEKRGHLARIHHVHNLYVTIQVDEALAHADHELERTSLGEHSLHPLDSAALALPAQALVEDDDFVAPDDEEDDEEIVSEDDDGAEAEMAARPARTEPREPRREDDSDGRGGRRRRRRRGGRRDEEETEVAAASDGPAEPAPELDADADGDEELDKDGRRRRRGRRGGRRSREEDRPRDGFAWARPRVPFGNDPFQWHDPATLEGGGMLSIKEQAEPQVASLATVRPEPVQEPVVTAPVIPDLAPAGAASFPDEVWVELPTEPETARKPRRSRTRGKKAEAEVVTESAEGPVEPEAVASTAETLAPEPATEVLETVPEVELAPEAEVIQDGPAAAAPSIMEAELTSIASDPKAVFAPVPTVVSDPDPSEIQAPPEKPKRGWWRR